MAVSLGSIANNDDPWVEPIVANTPPEAWRAAVARLQSLSGAEALNLVIRVRQPSEELPVELAEEHATIRRRVEELLSSEPSPDLPFTHGQRIFAWGQERGLALNQIDDYVVPVLAENSGSRRAIITLSDPAVDQTEANRGRSIVAPQLVQFDSRAGNVHVTAYYRAHDIYRFWPVNFIELVRLQSRVCTKLGTNPGTITTISHSAYLNSVAFSDAPSAFVLPIQDSELEKMSDASLRVLLDRVGDGDTVALDELKRLILSDLDKENYRLLSIDRYQTIAEVASQRFPEAASDSAARLLLAIRGLVTAASKEVASARAGDFLLARSIVDTMLYHAGAEPAERPIILAVEGLNSTGEWLDDLDHILKEDFPEATYIKRRFKISLPHVLLRRKEGLLKQFLHYYTLAVGTHESPMPVVMVIAHSYGSLIVATSAARFPDLRFDRMIFAGSVVKRNWDWSAADFKHLLNEVGKADRIARLAGYIGSLGDAGLRGFRPGKKQPGKVTNAIYLAAQHRRHAWEPAHEASLGSVPTVRKRSFRRPKSNWRL